MNGREGAPTHRVRWRIACDARLVGRGFQIHESHDRRVWQAGYLYGGLIADRCRFGPRRLVLEGEADYAPRRWAEPTPARYGQELAIETAKWTLKTLYGMDPGTSASPLGLEPQNATVSVRVTALSTVAA